MALVFADLVKELSTDTGTGNLELAGAIAGHQGFVAAIGDASSCRYMIRAVDAGGVPTGDWESGLGTITDATPDTISRAVWKSSNGDALVDFAAGDKHVDLVGPRALDVSFARCILLLDTLQTYANGAVDPLDFTSGAEEVEDTHSFHDGGGANPERITIPTGLAGFYVFEAKLSWASNANGERLAQMLHYNSVDALQWGCEHRVPPVSGNTTIQAFSLTRYMADGDYLYLRGSQTSGGDLDVNVSSYLQAYRLG